MVAKQHEGILISDIDLNLCAHFLVMWEELVDKEKVRQILCIIRSKISYFREVL